MQRRTKIAIAAAALVLVIGGVVHESTAPDVPPQISEDVAAVIDVMKDQDAWIFGREGIYAFHPKTHIGLYLGSYSKEIKIDVSDLDHVYNGLAIPLNGEDNVAFSSQAVKLREYLVAKRRPALTDYMGRIKNGGS